MNTVSIEPTLSVRDLVVDVATANGPLRIIDGVSFDVWPGEVLSVVGESGSGKSITMLAIMGLLSLDGARVMSGQIRLEGRDLVGLSADEFRRVRGSRIAMIFQDPMTSLNPVLRVGSQIGEIMRVHHRERSAIAVRDRVVELLTLVGVADAPRRYSQYPHEFSGGMRQRAMIAMAVANEPALLIADEPTTALDVTIQAQVMEVLTSMRLRTNASMILVTHDLGLVAEYADRVAVMYGGRLMELACIEPVFKTPHHPYTVGLMKSRPRLDTDSLSLYSIPGQPPEPGARPSGCVFQLRCDMRQGRQRCVADVPQIRPIGANHHVQCHFAEETPGWSSLIGAGERDAERAAR